MLNIPTPRLITVPKNGSIIPDIHISIGFILPRHSFDIFINRIPKRYFIFLPCCLLCSSFYIWIFRINEKYLNHVVGRSTVRILIHLLSSSLLFFLSSAFPYSLSYIPLLSSIQTSQLLLFAFHTFLHFV